MWITHNVHAPSAVLVFHVFGSAACTCMLAFIWFQLALVSVLILIPFRYGTAVNYHMLMSHHNSLVAKLLCISRHHPKPQKPKPIQCITLIIVITRDLCYSNLALLFAFSINFLYTDRSEREREREREKRMNFLWTAYAKNLPCSSQKCKWHTKQQLLLHYEAAL